jgi:hypothetical protein
VNTPRPKIVPKDGFVKGHRAIIFTSRHWLKADVIEASAGAVTVRVDTLHAAIFGFGKTRRFTWRRSVGRYVDEHDRRSKTGAYLTLDTNPERDA